MTEQSYDTNSPTVKALVAKVPQALRQHAEHAIPQILNAAHAFGVTDPKQIAYVLATAELESRFGQSMSEGGNGKSADGIDHYFDQYAPGGSASAHLGNVLATDGERYRGRGYVQVTGLANYEAWSEKLGLPPQTLDGKQVPYLVAHPERLTDPAIAAEVLVRGMRDGSFAGNGIGLDHYMNAKRADFTGARAIVNGSDRAAEFASTAQRYAAVLEREAPSREAVLHIFKDGRGEQVGHGYHQVGKVYNVGSNIAQDNDGSGKHGITMYPRQELMNLTSPEGRAALVAGLRDGHRLEIGIDAHGATVHDVTPARQLGPSVEHKRAIEPPAKGHEMGR